MEKSNNVTPVKFCFVNYGDKDIDVKDIRITINKQEVIKSGEFKIYMKKVVKISIPFPNVYVELDNKIHISSNVPNQTEVAFSAHKEVLDSINIYVSENQLQVDLPDEEEDEIENPDNPSNEELLAFLEGDSKTKSAKTKNKKKKRNLNKNKDQMDIV